MIRPCAAPPAFAAPTSIPTSSTSPRCWHSSARTASRSNATTSDILLVTLPEATPVHEAAALQEDLRRAHIEPFAWVINQSLLYSGSCDPVLQRSEESEHRYLREMVEKPATRTAWLLWPPEDPICLDAITRLASSVLEPTLS